MALQGFTWRSSLALPGDEPEIICMQSQVLYCWATALSLRCDALPLQHHILTQILEMRNTVEWMPKCFRAQSWAPIAAAGPKWLLLPTAASGVSLGEGNGPRNGTTPLSTSYFAGGDWSSPLSGVRACHGVQDTAASAATSPSPSQGHSKPPPAQFLSHHLKGACQRQNSAAATPIHIAHTEAGANSH